MNIELGLAIDLGSVVDGYTGNWNSHLNNSESNRDIYNWMFEHGAEYGFILRYPKGEEMSTGIYPESWHYRYIGKEAALDYIEEAKKYKKWDSSAKVNYYAYTYEKYHQETYGTAVYDGKPFYFINE